MQYIEKVHIKSGLIFVNAEGAGKTADFIEKSANLAKATIG